jgi:hypothetical protein
LTPFVEVAYAVCDAEENATKLPFDLAQTLHQVPVDGSVRVVQVLPSLDVAANVPLVCDTAAKTLPL